MQLVACVDDDVPAAHGEVESAMGVESQGVVAGDLVWVSGQLAATRDGPLSSGAAAAQLRVIFERLSSWLQAAGCELGDVLRLRAFLTDASDVGAVTESIRHHWSSDPPVVELVQVPGPLQVRECTVMIDAVASLRSSLRQLSRVTTK